MRKPDWTKAPDGATHYSEHGYMRWYKCENGGVCGYSDNRWVPLPLDVFSEKDKEALMEKPKEWRGPEDGLPPVGEIVRSIHHQGHGPVLASYFNHYENQHRVIWDNGDTIYVGTPLEKMRPAITEEDKAVMDMYRDATGDELCGDEMDDQDIVSLCQVLFKAGYRKQDASE